MQHYFKKLSIFLYICVALIVYSCAEEKDFVKEQNHEKIKMEDQSFDKLLQLPVFSDAYQRVVKAKVKIPNSAMARTALEEQYGFDIVTQVPVRIITTTDKGTYYVLLIERPIEEYLKFENLIINVKDTIVGALIMKYELSRLAEKEVYHDSYSMDIVDTSLTFLEVDGNKVWLNPCVETATLMCNYHTINPIYQTDHIADQNCFNAAIGLYVVWGIDCSGGGSSGPTGNGPTGSGDSGSGPSGPSGATGPAASGGGGAVGSVYTAPLPCLECIEETPCEKLKNLLKKDTIVNPGTPEADTIKRANLKPKIVALRPRVNETKEYGCSVGYLRFGDVYDHTFLEAPTANNSLAMPTASTAFGGIHVHTNTGQPIPSFGDLTWLLSCHDDAFVYNQSNVFSIVIVKDLTGVTVGNIPATITYALHIDNYAVFSQYVNTTLNCATCSEEQKDKKIREINNLHAKKYTAMGTDPADYEKEYLRLHRNHGFSLYKANNDLTNWSKLTLVNNVLDSIPCNN